jgi:hypothetical protein
VKLTIEKLSEFEQEQHKKKIQIQILEIKQRFEDAHIEHNLEKNADGAYLTGATHDLWLSFLAGFFLAEEMFYLVKKL